MSEQAAERGPERRDAKLRRLSALSTEVHAGNLPGSGTGDAGRTWDTWLA